MNRNMRYNIFLIAGLLFIASQVTAQDDSRRKTIDITSSFKPALLPAEKIKFNASPVLNNEARPALTYDLPVQNLAFRFYPAALKPLAFTDSVPVPDNKAYVKAGFGNFSTPFLRMAANFGNGQTSSGTVEGHYLSSKGNLPFQSFSRFGAKANSLLQLNENHSLGVRGGFAAHHTNRYGLGADTINIKEDSLKLKYNDLHLGATFGNQQANEAGLYYSASLDAHFFNDNYKGNETSLNFDLPLEKELGENATVLVGVSGMISKVNTRDSSFSNNLAMVRAGARVKLTDDIKLKASIIPSWNNKTFALMPDVELDIYMNEKDLVLQTGIKGSFVENNWRNLVAFNPWIIQPDFLTNSRNTEFFAAVKAVVDEHISFRVKGSFQRRLNVPLYVNDINGGKTFEVIWEPAMNISGATGEFNWQLGDKFSWYNQLTIQSFGGLKQASKAYGLLPVEFSSSIRAKLLDKLLVKGDLYNFGASWFRTPSGDHKRGEKGTDLNLGAEFEIARNTNLWLQFNNVFNQQYQRWNQYPVLGFQVIGGVILNF